MKWFSFTIASLLLVLAGCLPFQPASIVGVLKYRDVASWNAYDKSVTLSYQGRNMIGVNNCADSTLSGFTLTSLGVVGPSQSECEVLLSGRWTGERCNLQSPVPSSCFVDYDQSRVIVEGERKSFVGFVGNSAEFEGVCKPEEGMVNYRYALHDYKVVISCDPAKVEELRALEAARAEGARKSRNASQFPFQEEIDAYKKPVLSGQNIPVIIAVAGVAIFLLALILRGEKRG